MKSVMKAHKLLNKPETIYSKQSVSTIAVLIFVTIDFVCLYSLWNSTMTNSPAMVYLRCLGCAIGLDVPLSIAAYSLKLYNQKLTNRTETILLMGISLSVFSVAFIFYFSYMIAARNILFDIGSGSNINFETAAGNAQDTVNNGTLAIAASYSGTVPLITSLSAFVISYFGFDPLATKINRHEKALINLDEAKTSRLKSLEQIADPAKYVQEMVAFEDEKYNSFIEIIDSAENHIDVVSVMTAADYVGTSEATSKATTYCNTLIPTRSWAPVSSIKSYI